MSQKPRYFHTATVLALAIPVVLYLALFDGPGYRLTIGETEAPPGAQEGIVEGSSDGATSDAMAELRSKWNNLGQIDAMWLSILPATRTFANCLNMEVKSLPPYCVKLLQTDRIDSVWAVLKYGLLSGTYWLIAIASAFATNFAVRKYGQQWHTEACALPRYWLKALAGSALFMAFGTWQLSLAISPMASLEFESIALKPSEIATLVRESNRAFWTASFMIAVGAIVVLEVLAQAVESAFSRNAASDLSP